MSAADASVELWATRCVVHKSTGGRRRAELSGVRGVEQCFVRIEGDETVRPVEDSEPSVGILVHAHGRLDIMIAITLRGDPQGASVLPDAVIAADLAILLIGIERADRLQETEKARHRPFLLDLDGRVDSSRPGNAGLDI